MKKIILSVLSAGILATAANAQTIAPELGLNMANMKMTGVSSSMKVGAALGAIVDFGLTDNLSLQPGLFFAMNGCSISSPSVKYSVNSLQIPINVQYSLKKDGGLFFGAGPYLAYNLSAKSDPGGTINIGSDKAKDQIKAMDFGIGLNAGYKLANGLFFRLHYQMGLANLSPQDGGEVKTSALGITAGYYLGAKKAGKAKKGGAKK